MKYLKVDLSSLETEKLSEYKEMLEDLSFCVGSDNENAVELWKLLGNLTTCVRGEIMKRKNDERERKSQREKKRKSGVPVSMPKKMAKRPVLAKRKGI